LTFIIGVLTGLVAIFVTYVTGSLSSIKFQTVNALLDQENAGLVRPGTTFLAYAGFNMFFVLIASFMVYLEPFSAGSGIPEIKAFLNGVDYKGVIRVRTLICKVLGVMFSVAGGLPAGKEGPMVHSGSVLAAGVSQGKSNTLGLDTSFSKFQDFRNDKEKRDFVACGAAAGVAAAFGSPIGGVLFSLEEGASFWSTKLTWRAFFCAMMTVMTLYVVKNAEAMWLQPDQTKMFSFGEFYSLHQDRANYTVWELLLFVVIGCMGGLIGGASTPPTSASPSGARNASPRAWAGGWRSACWWPWRSRWSRTCCRCSGGDCTPARGHGVLHRAGEGAGGGARQLQLQAHGVQPGGLAVLHGRGHGHQA
ncbi:unnamed protein product, partial [Heterosigma akashiwo]